MREQDQRCEVWGLAAGRGSTTEAARGAFTVRTYRGPIPRRDWIRVLRVIQKDEDS